MTGGERLRKTIFEALKEIYGHGDWTWVDALIDALGLSLETLAWCRVNPEVIKALRDGTWVALPKQMTEEMKIGALVSEE